MDDLVKKKDIFDDMHIMIRCEYISDLRQHQLMVLYELGRMNLSSYSPVTDPVPAHRNR